MPTVESGGVFGPIVVAVVALIASIVRIRSKRRAIWVPLIGMVLAVAVYFIGWELLTAGAPAMSTLPAQHSPAQIPVMSLERDVSPQR